VVAAVISISDTRDLASDAGGALIVEMLEAAGHRVGSRSVVPDEADQIEDAASRALAAPETQAVIVTGGTGVAARDVTPDALEPLFDREIPGFGELFRWLSYQEIGTAAMLSRAIAGLVDGRVVFALPGSRAAVRLGMEKLILPELGHLVGEARKDP
jgi:molybdenum cofactor biosynthesis protein B